MVKNQKGQTVIAVSILIAIVSVAVAYTVLPRLQAYWINSADLSIKVSALDAVDEFGRQLQIYHFMGRQLEPPPVTTTVGPFVGPFLPTAAVAAACPTGYNRVDVPRPTPGVQAGQVSNSRPAYGVTTPNGGANLILCVPAGAVNVQDANRSHIQYSFRITSRWPETDRLKMIAEAQIFSDREAESKFRFLRSFANLNIAVLFLNSAFAENYWPNPPAASPIVSLAGIQPICAAVGFTPTCRWVCGTNARCIDVQMNVSGISTGIGPTRIQQIFVFPEDL